MRYRLAIILFCLFILVASVSAVFYSEPWGNDVDAGNNNLNNVNNITINGYYKGDASLLTGGGVNLWSNNSGVATYVGNVLIDGRLNASNITTINASITGNLKVGNGTEWMSVYANGSQGIFNSTLNFIFTNNVTVLGNVNATNFTGVWFGSAILDVFLDTLNASKLFNLANGLLNSHTHDLTNLTGAVVNCSQGYVTVFNATQGTISCAVDPAFNYSMDISDALTGALNPNGSNVFATFDDLTSGNITVASIFTVKNIDSIVPSGTPMYIIDYNSGLDRYDISRANNTNTSQSADCLAFGSIANNGNGQCIATGTVSNVDTSSWNEKDDLYLSTLGNLTNVRPRATSVKCVQKIGEVLRVHANQGRIEVFGAGRCNDVPNEINITGGIVVNGGNMTGNLSMNENNITNVNFVSFNATGYGIGWNASNSCMYIRAPVNITYIC